MAFDPIHLRVLANEKEEENWKFRQFLKQRYNSDELDVRVVEITRRVWAGIDCTTCANCCKEIQPSLSEEDMARLARRLGIDRQQFIQTYLEPTESGSGNPWKIRTRPCPFLKDDKCGVYEDRPDECRGYPYLDEPNFVSRTMGMIGRTFTCPIVFQVMEELKMAIGFSRRKRK
jgi:uncharacterized protein